MMVTVGTIFLVLAAALATEWVIAYHRKTGGRWRSGPMGRHLMAFMASIAAVLTLGAVHEIVVVILGYNDPTWFRVLRTAALGSIPAVILWRRILLARAQNGTLNSRQR